MARRRLPRGDLDTDNWQDTDTVRSAARQVHLFGCESTRSLAAAIGSAFAVVTFTFIQLYAPTCRHALARQTEHSRG